MKIILEVDDDFEVLGCASNGREAIEIAKAFSSEKSGNFINGILNKAKDELPESRFATYLPENKQKQTDAE